MANFRWMLYALSSADLAAQQPPIKGMVATSSALPATGNTNGDVRVALDTRHSWTWNGTTWVDGNFLYILYCDLVTMPAADIGKLYNITT